ncbi:hypothetical protein [Paenibacillus sp. ISL-20]|uniref:hypothetical protein n=1 Tax=Paenibacillus sp. ISL-20 TaxID=2819163 RepID=UPI001BE4FE21|nr:hypothetical protein [Paenibacillus sp. ISL-20]MBT2759890.1 hypothetical protein [Paenibacillus sp. ISL-20]
MDHGLEERLNELKLNISENKQQHEMAGILGSLGVSPKYMTMYIDSMKRINEFEKKDDEN